MPVLHLIDRPDLVEGGVQTRQGAGAAVSAVSHLVVASLVVLAVQFAPAQTPTNDVRRFNTQKLTWLPNLTDGGARSAGGARSTEPAQRARVVGTDAASAPASVSQSTAITNDTPIELAPIPVTPVGDSTQAFVGAIESRAISQSPGPGDVPGGDGPGRTPGVGNGRPGGRIGDGPIPGGPGVTTPVVIHQVKPQYTADAMRAKMQGSVWLECIVLPDGTVGDVRVSRSLDRQFGLDEEAIAAAKQWRFRPGLLEGQPVPVLVTIELTFTLR